MKSGTPERTISEFSAPLEAETFDTQAEEKQPDVLPKGPSAYSVGSNGLLAEYLKSRARSFSINHAKVSVSGPLAHVVRTCVVAKVPPKVVSSPNLCRWGAPQAPIFKRMIEFIRTRSS